MAEGVKPRVKLPETAGAGEVITVKTLIGHKMESGQRRDEDGTIVPRSIINAFRAEFDGESVFEAALEPAIAANPFIEFHLKVEKSGTLKLVWVDDDGSIYRHEQTITVV